MDCERIPEAIEPPPHVPADRIIDFDYFYPDGLDKGDIFAALKQLHEKPDIVWTPRNGGHWIATRSEDIRWIRNEPVLFSRTESVIPRGAMNTLMPPTNVDPPYHARFRAVLNPSFTPAAIHRIADSTRATAIRYIEQLKPVGRCDFVADFARVMPVVTFVGLLDLPTERAAEFGQWARNYINASDMDKKSHAAATVAAFLTEVLNEREANPGSDLFSRIAAFRRNPRFQREEEVIGMAMVSFFGGLDTVTTLMSFAAQHLAEHPEARRRIRDDPAIVPNAVEEYARRFGPAQSGRLITQDVTRKGVTMKKDDVILVSGPLASVDERAYPNPMEVDFDRDNRVHDTFGNGVHRCVGEHLARLEMTIFLEEWLKRIPDFRLDPGLPPKCHSGPVAGLSQLGLLWNV